MKKMTVAECAVRWGITKKKVMEKIYNTVKVDKLFSNMDHNTLPKEFKVRRLDSDTYEISVPKGYKFKRLAK